jgi:hypothetical protein
MNPSNRYCAGAHFFKKLIIPVNSKIVSRLYGRSDIVISFIVATADDTMKKSDDQREFFNGRRTDTHNYLDVKSTQVVYDYILHIDLVPTLKYSPYLVPMNIN